MEKIQAIVLAAGRGERLKAGLPKAFIKFNKKPLLVYSLQTFSKSKRISSIILTVPKTYLLEAKKIINFYGLNKVKAIIAGGRQRSDSVLNAVRVLDKDTEFVLIHDSARAFVSKDLISSVIGALRDNPAIIPVIDLVDTIKHVDGRGTVRTTMDRKYLKAVQTPQGFKRKIIDKYFKKTTGCLYDDSMFVEKKVKVKTIRGEVYNVKITSPSDLKLAKYIFRKHKINS